MNCHLKLFCIVLSAIPTLATADGAASKGTDPRPPERTNGASEGVLSTDQIAKVVKGHIKDVQTCYEAELTTRPDLQGKVVVRFEVGTDGKVISSEVSETSLKNVAAEKCIVDQSKTWIFPVPKGGSVAVSYPFVFEPGQKGEPQSKKIKATK
jgi:TonB family protein